MATAWPSVTGAVETTGVTTGAGALATFELTTGVEATAGAVAILKPIVNLLLTEPAKSPGVVL